MSGVITNSISISNNIVNCKPHGDCEININDNLADDSRKIFVGGLSWETNEEDLKKYFSEFGEVKSCIIKLDRYTNHSRGFGFVIFDSEDTVNKVLERKEHVLNKKKIDPKKAKPSREPQRKIFIGGLDPDLSELAIKEYFSQFGEIENIETPFDIRKNKRKAYIFVTFAAENDARKAASHEFQEIDGKKFEVRIAIPREQANRENLDWKSLTGSGNNTFYPYTMLPYMYNEYFYYMYNNPQLFNGFYNPYDVLNNFDPISLSLMINSPPQSQPSLTSAPMMNSRLKSPNSNNNNVIVDAHNNNNNLTIVNTSTTTALHNGIVVSSTKPRHTDT